jgi:hypothetical protein
VYKKASVVKTLVEQQSTDGRFESQLYGLWQRLKEHYD